MTTEPYGPAAYRGSALPALPPPAGDKQGLFDTALKWGHYGNLDSVSEVEGQLIGEAHLAYERQVREKRKQQIYCNADVPPPSVAAGFRVLGQCNGFRGQLLGIG